MESFVVEESLISCDNSFGEFSNCMAVVVAIFVLFGADTEPNEWTFSADELVEFIVSDGCLWVCKEDVFGVELERHEGEL